MNQKQPQIADPRPGGRASGPQTPIGDPPQSPRDPGLPGTQRGPDQPLPGSPGEDNPPFPNPNQEPVKAMAQGQGQGTSSSTGSKPSRDSKTGTYEDPLRRFDQDKGRDDLGSKSVDGAMTTDGDPAIATTQDKGEGSYEGTRRYDEGVRRFGAEKDVQGLAENARKAIDGPEGATLRDAEKRGKQGPALSQGTGGTGTSPARSTDGKTIPVASKPH